MSVKTIGFRRIALCFLCSLFLICAAMTTSAFGQDEDAELKLPAAVMREVVQRVIVYSFKPRVKPTKVFLYEKRIKREWLPEIKNIKFQLVPESAIKQSGDIYFFNSPSVEKGVYTIGFGYGNPYCFATGESFYFRVVKGKVRLSGIGNFGSGCGEGASVV